MCREQQAMSTVRNEHEVGYGQAIREIHGHGHDDGRAVRVHGRHLEAAWKCLGRGVEVTGKRRVCSLGLAWRDQNGGMKAGWTTRKQRVDSAWTA
eukprot:4211823-Pleurochrysis_carterae.AAC.1